MRSCPLGGDQQSRVSYRNAISSASTQQRFTLRFIYGVVTPTWHLFEFMDHARTPSGLRTTLREILECGNALPFRSYYRWVARKAEQEAHQGNFCKIVELGAGTAPVTRVLAREGRLSHGITLVPCDLRPDVDAYRKLASAHPDMVAPMLTPIDFSTPYPWGRDALLLLSATFHHVLPSARPATIDALMSSARRIVICEPLRKRASSFAYVVFSILPALLLPLLFIGRSGNLRRVLWCWLLPAAPAAFWWDGWVSCLRQWDAQQWQRAADQAGLAIRSFTAGAFSSCIVLEKRPT